MPVIWVRREPHHYYRERIYLSVYHLAHTLLDGEPVVSVGPCFTEFPETLSAIRLLAPLVNGDHALLTFEFGLHDAHVYGKMVLLQ